MGDVTGMTGLLDTPDKALVHGIVGKSGNVGVAAAGKLLSYSRTLTFSLICCFRWGS